MTQWSQKRQNTTVESKASKHHRGVKSVSFVKSVIFDYMCKGNVIFALFDKNVFFLTNGVSQLGPL